jgi:glutamine amidotransferase-like uncharacterized protein
MRDNVKIIKGFGILNKMIKHTMKSLYECVINFIQINAVSFKYMIYSTLILGSVIQILNVADLLHKSPALSDK